MIFNRSKQHWKLREFVQLNPDALEGASELPLQLLHFPGTKAEAASAALWFLAGFQGAGRNDSHICSLVHKALDKQTFDPCMDVYMTPIVNPSSLSKAPLQNDRKIDLSQDFSVEEGATPAAIESKTLIRWAKSLQPKAIVTFSIGAPKIRYLNTPVEVVQKLAELAEKPFFAFGSEPQEANEEGELLALENVEKCFGNWCAANGIAWIDITVDGTKKNFDELKDSDWRPAFGPALKWLVEGFRFNPPKEEAEYTVPPVIPALEMPPEFANLL